MAPTLKSLVSAVLASPPELDTDPLPLPESDPLVLPLLQAARERLIAKARAIARIFFIVFIILL